MAASNKNELALNDASEADIQTGGEPVAPVEATAEPAPRRSAPANEVVTPFESDPPLADLADSNPAPASDLDGGAASDNEGSSDGSDDDFTATFVGAPPAPGEFRVPLSKLGEWGYHLRVGSREKGAHFHALSLVAAEPDDLRPLVVLPPVDGVYPIFDGRFTWHALKAVHAGNEDVEVRCIRFAGSEADAVAAMCDTALGTIEASAMEKGQALLNLQQVNGISQRAIAERYPRFSEDKVSNMLIAARMRRAYPMLFDILAEPELAPISYGTSILTLRKEMSDDAFQAMLDRAEDIAANGERLKPKVALDALQGTDGATAESGEGPVKPKPVVPVKTEEIFGHDDQPVAAYERFSDDVDRISLPDASAMSLEQREAAAEACIAHIRRHFGLDQQG